MSGGLELSFVTEGEGWVMFDSMNATATLMPVVISSFDADIAEIIKNDPVINSLVTNLIRAEYISKGWIGPLPSGG